MARPQHTRPTAGPEEAITVVFCLIDDEYPALNPRAGRYESLKRLSDSEVLSLALLQQLRVVESERSFLRDAERSFAHLFPGVTGLAASSFHRRLRKLGRFLEPLRRAILPELMGEPETLVVDSTLLPVPHPRQVKQSTGWGSPASGAAWARWGSFSVFGVKLHLLCDANRVPRARVPPRRDAGEDVRRLVDQDRGEGDRLHLRLPGQPAAGASARAHQGAVGPEITATDI